MARKPATPAAPPEPLRTYGCHIDPQRVQAQLGAKAQFFYWQWAFANHQIAINHGAPPRDELFWKIADVLMPGYFVRDPWSERMINALCHNNWCAIAGCSSSGKTYNVTGFAALWWLCDPLHSSVLFCSTTAKSLRRRNWANVQKIHSMIPGMPIGNFVDSRMQWQSKRGDDLNAIIGIAVEEGDTKASADKIKGTHTKRQMVVVNEANSVNGGIWEAVFNLHSYPEQCGGEFILAAEANPSSWLDEFGKFSEPENGVTSVTVNDEEWTTKPQLNGKKGICVRFDVEKTPNLDYPADKPISKHLPSRERAERCMNSPTKDSALYWSNERGFPPPQGLNKNVFSEVSMQNCGAYDRHKFTGNNFQIIGAFDPARTGDRPTLRFAAFGEIESGDMGLEWMPPIVIPVNVALKNPIDYQIIEQLRRECENVKYRGTKTSCPPKNLGIDASGGGADFCDIVNRTWSFDVMRIGFGEAASTDACSHEDVRPANEVYRNKRAEMYMKTRHGMDSGQIKGVDPETVKEMVTLLFDDSKALLVIEDKKDYKKRTKNKSPDFTDCFIAGTMVETPQGSRAIESLTIGDSVTTPMGAYQVGSVYVEDVSDLTEVTFSDGSTLTGKGKHRVFTWDSGWKGLDELCLGNSVESVNMVSVWNTINELFGTEEHLEFKAVADTIKIKTKLRRRDFYTGLSGLSTTAIFLKACASITRTAIGSITNCLTWNSERLKNTLEGMLWHFMQIPRFDGKSCLVLRKPGLKRQSGTNPKLAESGTSTTRKTLLGLSKQRNSNASSAVLHSWRSHTILNSVQLAVETNTSEQCQRIRKPGNAFSAIARLVFSSLTKQRLAPLTVRHFTATKPVKVYNLTLDRHNVYYANGILVENCGVMLTEVARRKGFKLAIQGQTIHKYQSHEKIVEEADALFSEVNYSSENEQFEEMEAVESY